MPKKYLSAIIFAVVCIVIAIIIAAVSGGSSSGWQAPTTGPDTSVQPTTGPDGKPLTPTTTAGTYTMADIAKHAVASNCWTTVDGSVYDVTAWISRHPGGQQAIIGLCGRDGSEAFDGQHGGERRPTNELASFKIGTLSK